MFAHLVGFALACAVIAISPGPATALLVRQSVRGQRRTALATVLGIEAGVLFWAIAAAFGLSALLVASEVAYTALKVIGVCVLLWIGGQTLWSARKDRGNGHRESAGPRQLPLSPVRPAAGFRAGLMTNLANPKAAVFAISFLPQFVAPGAPVRSTLLLFAVVWVAVDLSWYLTFAMLLTRLSRWLVRPPVRRRLEQVSGTVLIGLGIKPGARLSVLFPVRAGRGLASADLAH